MEHGQDFTYSLICPGRESLPTTIEFYRFVHLAIANILRKSGCPVEIAQSTDPSRSPACFEKAVQFDLKLRGEKIAGAAIRRNRKGLLLQGSIQRLEVPVQFDVMLAAALGERVDSFVVSDLIDGTGGADRERKVRCCRMELSTLRLPVMNEAFLSNRLFEGLTPEVLRSVDIQESGISTGGPDF